MSKIIKQPLAWHGEAWMQLQQQIRDGKLPHAMLLCADSDTGKRHFAMLLAQFLLCARPATGAPCGECDKCLLNAAGNHPDLMVVEAEPGSRIIKVDQIRELRAFVETSSHSFGYRIIVLDTAETLNVNGANALLKSLEEPPAQVLFLLLSDRPKAVLPTIASRTQVVRLPVPTHEQALAWLSGEVTQKTEGEGFEQLKTLLQFAQNRPLLALTLYEDGLLTQLQDIDAAMLDLLSQRRLPSVLASTYAKPKQRPNESPNETLTLLTLWASSLSRFLMTAQARYLSSDAMREAAKILEQNGNVVVQTQRLFSLYTDICETRQQISNGANPNLQLLLEDLFIRIQRLTRPEHRSGMSSHEPGITRTQHRAG